MNRTVKRLTDKGFGFIAAGDGTEYFFHQSAWPARIAETNEVRPSGCWPDDVWTLADWQSNSPGKITELTQTFTRFGS